MAQWPRRILWQYFGPLPAYSSLLTACSLLPGPELPVEHPAAEAADKDLAVACTCLPRWAWEHMSLGHGERGRGLALP